MTQIEQTKIHRPQLLDIQAVVQASLLQLVAAVTVVAPVLLLQLVAAVTVVARVLRLVLAAMVREWLFLRVTLAHMQALAITVT